MDNYDPMVTVWYISIFDGLVKSLLSKFSDFIELITWPWAGGPSFPLNREKRERESEMGGWKIKKISPPFRWQNLHLEEIFQKRQQELLNGKGGYLLPIFLTEENQK